jgi:predicted alpha-1,2-mannosidase
MRELKPVPGLASSILAIFLGAIAATAQVENVDPTIGGVGYLLEPTRPTVHLPHSMVRVYPVRRDQLDDQIESFPLTIISHRLGELFWLMPQGGPPNREAWQSRATYDHEITTPYYYSVKLDDSGVQIEFTPAERCGCFRFTYPGGKPAVLLANRQGGDLTGEGTNVVQGYEQFHGMKAFVYGEFSAPASFFKENDADKARLTVTAVNSGKVLEFRYGISFISVEQARQNLAGEIADWNFDDLKTKAKDRWNQTLGQIEVEGGTPAQRRVFYTALYRCSERMINISENGQYYSSSDHQVHRDARPFYVDNWIWDMHKALEPLQGLLDPQMQEDQIQSYVRMYEQSGWMPSFAVLWGDYPCMTGNHAAAWIADSWFKGLRNFDLKAAYEGLRKNSLEATLLPWRNGPGCSLDDFYNQHGYFPALRPGEKETVALVNPFERRQAVAVTLEQSYDDWCTAQIARALGNAADFELFIKRAANYRNVYRQDKGFMWPKDAEGNWIEPFDPKNSGGPGGRDYFTENNGFTYNWDVQEDFTGLFALMGGRSAAEAKLDQLFREEAGRPKFEYYNQFPDSTGLVGQFVMGNEPSLDIPYIYNHLGVPWKTQKRIRMLLDSWFTDTLQGVPGDEDGGGLSAFVVFSMLGFYPVVPGVPVYELGSPVFDAATIHLPNGKSLGLVCKNNSHENKYVQSVRLNGKTTNRLWFRHAEMANGLTIELEMSDTPNHSLGVNPSDLPPSALGFNPMELEFVKK